MYGRRRRSFRGRRVMRRRTFRVRRRGYGAPRIGYRM